MGLRTKKTLPPSQGRFRFNGDVYNLLKQKLEKNVSGAQVHSLASHLNQIRNNCINFCYWMNKDIISHPDNYVFFNKYNPIRVGTLFILDDYGEKDLWNQLVYYDEKGAAL
jgi:hypothetical protein